MKKNYSLDTTQSSQMIPLSKKRIFCDAFYLFHIQSATFAWVVNILFELIVAVEISC